MATVGSTVQLRLRGTTPRQLAAGVVAAAPLAYFAYLSIARHAPLVLRAPVLLTLCALVALMPWVSRALARAAYRAKVDDVAIHVRGEALPYRTIRELRVDASPRRTVLRVVRSADIELALVLKDAYAGRLEPFDVLRERLAAHGFAIGEP